MDFVVQNAFAGIRLPGFKSFAWGTAEQRQIIGQCIELGWTGTDNDQRPGRASYQRGGQQRA